MKTDQYGNEYPNDLVLLPDIKLLNENGIRLVTETNWYDVILEDDTIWLACSAKAINYLSDCPVEDADFSSIAEVMKINDVLKRWSIEDNFYHA